eukprot:6212621-Pleurochrysis_carterae.AAC.2
MAQRRCEAIVSTGAPSCRTPCRHDNDCITSVTLRYVTKHVRARPDGMDTITVLPTTNWGMSHQIYNLAHLPVLRARP